MRHALIAGLFLCGPAAAQAPGALSGTVLGENATPVALARIRIAGTDPVVLSDRDGRFHLTGIAVGRQVLEVRQLGYVAVRRPVEIGEGETLHVEIVLDPAPLPLKAVEVKGERALLPAIRGFEERRSRGNGFFFNRQEITRMQPRVFTDVLRRVPGVQIQSFSTAFGPSDMVRMSRTIGVTGTRPCPVLYYLNGTPLQATGDMSINQFVLPEEIVAIEVYSGMSEIPPQFQSNLLNARCGVIVIWTRSGNEEDIPPRRRPPPRPPSKN